MRKEPQEELLKELTAASERKDPCDPEERSRLQHYEREMKFRDADLDQVTSALEEAGGSLVSAACWERNWVLDDDRGSLLAEARLLRVRECSDQAGTRVSATLTVKAPAPPSQMLASAAKGIKLRIERETRVNCADEILGLFRLLGYEPVRRYDKVRTTWLLDDHEIVLDRTPMGDFVEIEGEAPSAIAPKLGLGLDQADVRNYLALFDEYCATHAEDNAGSGRDMLFAGGAPLGFSLPPAVDSDADPDTETGPESGAGA